MKLSHVFLLAVLWTIPAATAQAKPWDLIYISHATATLCEGCGITTTVDGFGILANTGVLPLTVSEMTGATFTAVSSIPGVSLYLFLNYYSSLFDDLAAGHARGNGGRAQLAALVHPNEVLEDPHAQFLAYNIERGYNTYQGPVTFQCTMELAGQFVEFDIVVDLLLGPHSYDYFEASRISSATAPVAARTSSWGAIKSLYR